MIDRQFSSGGAVFKRAKTKGKELSILWLVTKSATSKLFPKSVWRLPKGRIDDSPDGKDSGPIASGKKKATEKDLQKVAIRETEEEGGVGVRIIKKVGTFQYFLTLRKKRYMKFVTFYLMEWEKDLKEGFGFETSEIKWLGFKEAREILDYKAEKEVLDKAKKLLDR